MQEGKHRFTYKKFFQLRNILLSNEGKHLTVSSLKSELKWNLKCSPKVLLMKNNDITFH